MTDGTAAAETRGYGRDAGLLTIALGSAGLLTYLYFALASHNLSRDEYGEIVVLWSAVYVTVATLFRPIEQLLARSLAELGENAAGRRRVIRGALLIQLVIAATAIALALVPSGPVEDELLGGDGTLFAIFLAAMVSFGATFFARGYLAGRRRFGAYGGLLLIEGLARVGFALVTTQLLQIIGLLLAGGILLLWVSWKLWRELRYHNREDAGEAALEGKDVPAQQPKSFRDAAMQIIVADVSMSLDNVLAVAGAARDHTWVLIVGLVFSVALMGLAATWVARLLNRHHWIAYLGLFVILYVALRMIWDGAHEVLGVI